MLNAGKVYTDPINLFKPLGGMKFSTLGLNFSKVLKLNQKGNITIHPVFFPEKAAKEFGGFL
jgi:hypothetical protein